MNIMQLNHLPVLRVFFLLTVGLLTACSGGDSDVPELGQVSGTITLDGQPLEGASVTFEPQTGTLSTGSTDASGHYELVFNKDHQGAVLGTHTVRISKRGEPGTPNDTQDQIPAKFNANSKLTAEVKAGDNTVNFDLESK